MPLFRTGHGYRRTDFNPRWIIALIIAGVALVTCYTNAQENSVTGGRQPEFMLTHPHPESHREQIREFLKKSPVTTAGRMSFRKRARSCL